MYVAGQGRPVTETGKYTEGGGPAAAEQPPPWLLQQKISVPERAAGYFHRGRLVELTLPTQRCATVLMAPGGFGKTTLLAECCRRLARDGVPTAWVSLDEEDEPGVLDSYIAFACQRAGLDIADGPEPDEGGGGPESRAGFVLRAIAALGRPFVLAFDELERLGNPASVALLDFLLQRAPGNLHLALACRHLPVGLNIAGAVLEGRAAVLTADQLRFSRTDVAEFFDRRLSGSEMDRLIAESAGWPFALRIARNGMQGGIGSNPRAMQNLVENWVESRLFEGIGRDDREFLLDIGLFDWIDAALLDEVLERNDSHRRLDTMPVLVGLLEPVGGGAAESWRLHPLVREHCARRRFREMPQRYRSIHRRLAAALVRRGEPVAGMRHAVEAEDPGLAGRILEDAGGACLWIRQGAVQLQAANRLLSEEIVAERPRLALVRCLSLVLSGQLEAARERYRTMVAAPRAGTADGDGPGVASAVEDCIVRGGISLYGGEPVGSAWAQALLGDLERLTASPDIDTLMRGYLEYAICVFRHVTAEFDSALDRAARARQCLSRSPYMTMHIDLQVGQIAMAQGRVEDAGEHYRRARRIATKSFALDDAPAASARVHLHELALECHRLGAAEELHSVPGALVKGGASLSAYAAASGAIIDLRLVKDGVEAALGAADEMLEYVRGAGLPVLVRVLSALRVSVLASAGRAAEAERAWRLEELPEALEGCLDLSGQSWREMEALSCARLGLLIAGGRFDAARSFAAQLRVAADGRGLRRTLMRGLALSMVLERRAGESAEAAGHLEAFLRLFAETPYMRPLIREREACAAVVSEFLESEVESPYRETAQSLLAAMKRFDAVRPPELSEREKEVLERLGRLQDKQIAAELGLTAHGVRYHLRKLFTKLGANTRVDALRRARELDLLRGES